MVTLKLLLEQELEEVSSQGRALCQEIKTAESQLEQMKKRAEALATRASGVLLVLGYNDAEALREVREWRK